MALTPGNYLRGRRITATWLHDLVDYCQIYVMGRVKTHYSFMWGQYDAAGDDLDERQYAGGAWGLMLDDLVVTPSAGVRFLKLTSVAKGALSSDGVRFKVTGDGNTRYYTHIHTTGITKISSLCAVDDATTYTLDVEVNGNCYLMSMSISDNPMVETDLYKSVPVYTTVTAANTALSPTGGEMCVVNGVLLSFMAGSLLEYPGRDDNATGIWVPHRWRDAKVLGVYEGGTAEGSAPNSSWGWVGNIAGAGSSIDEAGAVTSIIKATNGAGFNSYLSLATVPRAAGSPLMFYMNMQIQSQGGSSAGVLPRLYDGTLYNMVRPYLSAAAGRVYMQTTTVDYTLPAALTPLYYIQSSDYGLSFLVDYDTQETLVADAYLSGTADVNTQAFFGSLASTPSLDVDISGMPALALLEARV